MTKQELWKIYTDKNPAFVEAKTVTITTDSLYRLFDQTWDQAVKSVQVHDTSRDDLFRQMFGGGR
jgi:hypothetical protein